MKRLLLAAALASMAVLAPVASAATPFTVGDGKTPHLAVDPASGTAHLVWRNDPANHITYCRIPRGAGACDVKVDLDASNGGLGPGSPFVLLDGSTVRIVESIYSLNKTAVFTSSDGGASWGSAADVYKFANVTDPTEPIAGPDAGSFTIAGANPANAVWSAAFDGSEVAKTDHATLPGGGRDLQVAPTGDGGLVAVAHDGANVSYWRMAPGSDPSLTASWSGQLPLARGEDARVAGGPGGAYVLISSGDPTNKSTQVRKWTGSGWSDPVVVAAEQPYINDVFVGPSGAVAAIWRGNDSPHRLMYALSTNGGATFTNAPLAREDVVMASMDVAIASDLKGFATYEGEGGGATSQIRVVAIDGPPSTTTGTGTGTGSGTGPTTTVKSDVPGGQLSFSVPKACVPAGRKIFAKLAFKRFRRNARGRLVILRVKKADFFIGTKRVKTDRKAPFVQQLTIKNPKPGARYTVKVKAKLATKNKLKSPTKTVSAKITICA